MIAEAMENKIFTLTPPFCQEALSIYIITYCLRKSQIFGGKWKIEGVYKTVW